MATWTDDAVLIAALAAGKAFTDEKAQALAENVRAAMEGAAGGPKLLDAALDTGVATAAGITWVADRTIGMGTGGVGSYAFLRIDTLTGLAAGATRAGSALRYSSGLGQNTGGIPAGTWRLLGATTAATNEASTSLFVRIS